MDRGSAHGLLARLGVQGDPADLDRVAAAGGHHAKAVELLGTYLKRFYHGQAGGPWALPPPALSEEASDDEENRISELGRWTAEGR